MATPVRPTEVVEVASVKEALAEGCRRLELSSPSEAAAHQSAMRRRLAKKGEYVLSGPGGYVIVRLRKGGSK